MREIEFRGKSTHNGEWHYGWLTYSKLHNAYEITDGNGVYNFVDPDTVGQYTGKTDRNEKKIFVGDIVKYGERTCVKDVIEESIGIVCFEKELCCFCIYYEHDNFHTHDYFSDIEYAEVIGNIHDNPELLEG